MKYVVVTGGACRCAAPLRGSAAAGCAWHALWRRARLERAVRRAAPAGGA
jgi:hypothetical protein